MAKPKTDKLAEGKKRQAAAKKVGAARIRQGQQKQTATKNAIARARGAKAS